MLFSIISTHQAFAGSFLLADRHVEEPVQEDVEVCPDGIQEIIINGNIHRNVSTQRQIISNAFANLKSYKYDNAFQLCFNLQNFGASEFITILTPIKINYTLDLALVISGLKLKMANSDEPVIQVESGRKVILANMQISDSAHAISLAGTGLHEVRDSVLSGNESGDGISISSDKAKIIGTEVSIFLDGIHVAANNVSIEESSSHDNKYGVHQLKDFSGLKVLKSLAYRNVGYDEREFRGLNAFRIDGSLESKTSFFAERNGIIQEVEKTGDVFEFSDSEQPYLVPPSIKGDELTIDFYYTAFEDCSIESDSVDRDSGQPCKHVELEEPVKIQKEALENEETVIRFPDSAKNKTVVVLFTDSKEGVIPVSESFKFQKDDAKDPIVLIGAQPISLPSSPQAISEDNLASGGEIEVVDGEETKISGANGASSNGAEAQGLSSITSSGAGGGAGGCSLSAEHAPKNTTLLVFFILLGTSLIYKKRQMH
ncbi:MAG: hypothetical protein COX62_03025 [Deltaproteobacteria bacterium CG_4_10_14_0_2_um_filter_43_8]|nr:MAG: hypothetical protein COX62_03025 [Deltaproteobacteria bacterium CG_4_10_14_0_2_um_filter_43_8]PJC64961.1 MAG: hypothetical protein CO021_01620 [Deltaproteobacteria bacterium CG_4_9_14_0_2_um_filter_42_21]